MSVEVLFALCKERNIAISRVEKDLGYGNGYFRSLKKKEVPGNRLKEVADYFGVSVDYFLYGKEKTATPEGSGISEKDVKLLAWFRSLPPETQKAILYDADAPEGLV